MRHRQILFLGNFSEFEQTMRREVPGEAWAWGSNIIDLVTGQQLQIRDWLPLESWQFVWLQHE